MSIDKSDIPQGYEVVEPKNVDENCVAFEPGRDGKNTFSFRITTESHGGETWKYANYSIQQHGGYLDRKVGITPEWRYENHNIVFLQEK